MLNSEANRNPNGVEIGELIKGDIVEEIADLKRREGKDIAVHGSAALVRTLLEHDPVGELRPMVFPMVLGRDKRLFEETEETKAMNLEDVKPLGPNVVVLTYRPAGKGANERSE